MEVRSSEGLGLGLAAVAAAGCKDDLFSCACMALAESASLPGAQEPLTRFERPCESWSGLRSSPPKALVPLAPFVEYRAGAALGVALHLPAFKRAWFEGRG